MTLVTNRYSSYSPQSNSSPSVETSFYNFSNYFIEVLYLYSTFISSMIGSDIFDEVISSTSSFSTTIILHGWRKGSN